MKKRTGSTILTPFKSFFKQWAEPQWMTDLRSMR